MLLFLECWDRLFRFAGKMKIKFLLIFSVISILASGKQEYEIFLWGVHVADVTFSHRDTVYNSIQAHSINFTTRSRSLAGKLFPVNNTYHTIVKKNNYEILSFSKDTHQPGVENHLITIKRDNKLFYENTETIIPSNSFNIFSLLDYLKNGITSKTENGFVVEREGRLYKGEIKMRENNSTNIKYELFLELKPETISCSIKDNTDIFTWAVFKPTAVKYIWFEKKSGLLVKCQFKFGLYSMTAEIK